MLAGLYVVLSSHTKMSIQWPLFQEFVHGLHVTPYERGFQLWEVRVPLEAEIVQPLVEVSEAEGRERQPAFSVIWTR